jgi:hypothetical protein
LPKLRRRLVALARRGVSQRRLALRFHVALSTIQYWLARTVGQRLDRVDFFDRPTGSLTPCNSTPHTVVARIRRLRLQLRRDSILGEFGPAAIRRALAAEPQPPLPLPSLRTIARILKRWGLVADPHRIRRPPPPPGWYLPAVAQGRAELDAVDVIEDLVLRGGVGVDVLTTISLHGALAAAWPKDQILTDDVLDALAEHWHSVGRPTYAQFDNDTRFQGSHRVPDQLGRVIRFCLRAGVIPVFAPPREHGPQNLIESFNQLWQRQVWRRFRHRSRAQVRHRSAAYVAAHRIKTTARQEAAPPRSAWPAAQSTATSGPRLAHHVIFLRRTDAEGRVKVLGRTYPVDPDWPRQLVRCELDLRRGRWNFYGLRRRAPNAQPLLRTGQSTLTLRSIESPTAVHLVATFRARG